MYYATWGGGERRGRGEEAGVERRRRERDWDGAKGREGTEETRWDEGRGVLRISKMERSWVGRRRSILEGR